MNQNKPKVPKKGAVKRMRELYEKNRGKASSTLVDILKTPSLDKEKDKQSAVSRADQDMEL